MLSLRLPLACLLAVWLAAPAAGQTPAQQEGWVAPAGLDLKRPGGKIVVWALPEAQKKFGPRGLQAVVDAAEAAAKKLGISQRLVVFTGKVLSRKTVDSHGKLVLLGAKPDVLSLGKANGLLTETEVDWLERSWLPEDDNPEKSDFHPGGGGRFSVVDVQSCYGFSKKYSSKLTPAEAAALFSLHGVSHQAGMSHPDTNNFVGDGNSLVTLLQRGTLMALYDPKIFSEGEHRSDVKMSDYVKQRVKWDAAFKL